MKKLFIIGIVLLLIACQAQQNPQTPQQSSTSIFKGGKGIIATFEPLGPVVDGVPTIFDTESFPVEIRIKNNGEYDLNPNDVYVELKGINLADFQGITPKTTNPAEIAGVTEFNIEGDEAILDFTIGSGDAKYTRKVTGLFQPEIFANIEYRYQTDVIIPNVCFKYNIQEPGVCEVRSTLSPVSSGGPIKVTSAKQDSAGKGIIVVTFTIENNGGGRVTSPATEFSPNFDKVGFSLVSDPSDWDCKSAGNQNEARLVNGAATIICRLLQPLQEDEVFIKQLEVKLDYRYKTIISQSLRIRESLE